MSTISAQNGLATTEHPLKAGFPVTFNRKSNQNPWSVLTVSGIS